MADTVRTRRTLRLTDPKQMRALAHPLRLGLLGLLRTDGPATATALADRLEISVPLASYHLRQLGEHGFIEEAANLARDGRERWWRSVHDETSWSTVEFLDTPDRLAAESTFSREIARRRAEIFESWLTESPTWPREWVEASDQSDWLLYLTPEELRRLRSEIAAVVDRYRDLPARDRTERVQAMVQLFPRRVRPS